MSSLVSPVRRRAISGYRRWHNLPLRTRLTTVAALAATLTVIAVISVAYVAVRHQLRGQIDSQLRRQVRETTIEGVDPFTGSFRVRNVAGDIGGYAQVINGAGTSALHSDHLPISAHDIEVARGDARSFLRDGEYNDKHVRLITAPVPNANGFAIQIALPLTEVDHQLHELTLAFLVLAAGGLGATVLLSWVAVRRVTRPVRTLTEAAEQIAVTRDLTLRITAEGTDELGRLAGSFNTMLDALERSLAAQRQLVTDASHELRTPLASLRTNAEVLNDIDRLTPDKRRAVLSGIVTQLDELTGLVADVVELARGEAPPSAHELVLFDELVSRAVERAQRHWPETRFDVTTVPVTVRGTPQRLDRAVANMLDNAGKFSPAGSVVDVVLDATGQLVVADRGPGVPPDALPHVFDRFFRADEARSMPGSGLGLAIVQQVVEGHGGTIALNNRPGGGTVAALQLPVAEDATSTPRDAGAAESKDRAAESNDQQTPPMPVEESLFR